MILLYYPHIFYTTDFLNNIEKHAEKDCPVMCSNIVKAGRCPAFEIEYFVTCGFWKSLCYIFYI